MEYRLKPEIIERIKNDALLWGHVANVWGISPHSLWHNIRTNSPKFTQKTILKAISDYLNIPENDLVEVIEEPEAA